MAADPSTPTYLELHREASPCLANHSARFALHRPRRANDVRQYGGIANRRVALAGAMSNVKSNLNAACSDEVEC